MKSFIFLNYLRRSFGTQHSSHSNPLEKDWKSLQHAVFLPDENFVEKRKHLRTENRFLTFFFQQQILAAHRSELLKLMAFDVCCATFSRSRRNRDFSRNITGQTVTSIDLRRQILEYEPETTFLLSSELWTNIYGFEVDTLQRCTIEFGVFIDSTYIW